MALSSITVDIQAPPDRVWAVLCDVERWPEWTATTTSVQRLDTGPLAVGSRARLLQPKLRPAVWEVTELDEGTGSFIWVTRSPGVQVTGRHLVEENKGGSRVTLSIQFAGILGPLVALLYRSLNQRYIAIEAEGLRKRCEAE
ncbi:MAG: SRPBCC family protein [Terriglobia bacterium]